MAFNWKSVVDIIQSEGTRTRNLAKSTMNELARLEGESRERASRTLAGAKERQNDLIMSYYDAFAQEKAVEEINTANEQLGQLGILYEPIPINRNTITEQRKSGCVWAQNYITYTEAADKKARQHKESRHVTNESRRRMTRVSRRA